MQLHHTTEAEELARAIQNDHTAEELQKCHQMEQAAQSLLHDDLSDCPFGRIDGLLGRIVDSQLYFGLRPTVPFAIARGEVRRAYRAHYFGTGYEPAMDSADAFLEGVMSAEADLREYYQGPQE